MFTSVFYRFSIFFVKKIRKSYFMNFFDFLTLSQWSFGSEWLRSKIMCVDEGCGPIFTVKLAREASGNLVHDENALQKFFSWNKIRIFFPIFIGSPLSKWKKIEKISRIFNNKKIFCPVFSSWTKFPEASRASFSAKIGPQPLSVSFILDRSHYDPNDHWLWKLATLLDKR